MGLYEEEMARALSGILAPVKSVTDPETTEEIETVGEETTAPAYGGPVLLSPIKVSNFFQHPDTHPIALDLLLLKKYDMAWLSWEPETLEIVIQRDFSTTISEVNVHKANAVKTLHLVDTYWKQWEIFNACTIALNGAVPSFDVLQVPTVAQCAVSVDISKRVRDDVAWGDEVKEYLKAVYRFDGIFCPQEPVDMIKLDTSDLVVDCAEVSAKWPAVRQAGKAPAEESITAEQLRRLLLVDEVVASSRDRLRQQLRLVQHV